MIPKFGLWVATKKTPIDKVIHPAAGTKKQYSIQTLYTYPLLNYLIHILPKTNMTMENQPFEDISPIEHGDFPMSC